MKKSLLLLLAVVCIATVFAQAPQSIPYQAVARDSFGTPIPSQAMQARISIRNLTSTGTILYRETDTFTTSSMGLFTINIGQGIVVSGTFSSIPWGTGAKFLQVELDPTGGTSYVDLGASQLLSVPYALFAGGAEGSGAAANGLHSDSSTIKLGGPLTDSLTLVTVPFNKVLVFSPDSVEMGEDGYRGLMIAHADFDGDTATAIRMVANYGGFNTDRYLALTGANSPVTIVSEILGDTAQFSESAQVNISVLHYGDSGDPIAFSGFAARPHETGLVSHGYSGAESKITLDTSAFHVVSGSATLNAEDENIRGSIFVQPSNIQITTGYKDGSSPPITYFYMDTTAFNVNLKHGSGFQMNPGSFFIQSGTGSQVFSVDTFGAASLNSLRTGFTNKTSAYTLTNSDYTVNCTSGTFALTLPSAAGIAGRTYVLNNSGTGTITINTTSSQTIDGNASGTLTLAQWHNYTVQSDGGNWIILSAK